MEALALTERCAALSRVMLNVQVMAALDAIASPTPPSAAFATLCAAAASAYSVALLKAYVVGPIIGALPNKVAAAPLAAAVGALAALRILPTGGRLAHAVSLLLPLIGAGSAAVAVRALERLRARFVYTEEAKALQIS